MNFEYDGYKEAIAEFPDQEIVLETKKGRAIHQKTDVYNKTLYYSYEKEPGRLHTLKLENVKSIIEKNKRGKLPKDLEQFNIVKEEQEVFNDFFKDDDLTRFDKKEKKHHKPRNKPKNRNNNKNFKRKPKKTRSDIK